MCLCKIAALSEGLLTFHMSRSQDSCVCMLPKVIRLQSRFNCLLLHQDNGCLILISACRASIMNAIGQYLLADVLQILQQLAD